MHFQTINEWDEAAWSEAEVVFNQSFPEKGRKTTKIIRSLLEKHIFFLHTMTGRSGMTAMALTAKLEEANALLIDYLAVRPDIRGGGIGRSLVDRIKQWAVDEQKFDAILIEIESEDNDANNRRLQFWKKCGFELTSYVHRYIWVPETYQAMYTIMRPSPSFATSGEALFAHITKFHNKAYRGK